MEVVVVRRTSARNRRPGSRRPGSRAGLFALLVLLLAAAAALPLSGGGKDKLTYGEGLTVTVPLPESEVEQVVAEVVQNGVIRGTKEYNKDEFVGGAKAASSSRVFPAWNEGGKVFYKVREQAIDPRNFKDSSDVGTLVVRYVVLAQGEKNTVLRIDALFEEDFRHMVHQSNGSVETAEHKDIREHIEAIELMKKQDAEAQDERQEQVARKQKRAAQAEVQAWPVPQSDLPVAAPAVESAPGGATASPGESSSNQSLSDQSLSDRSLSDQSLSNLSLSGESPPSQSAPAQALSGQSLEQHVKALRQQLERLVKAPGAPLKSAPFHTASTLQSLPAGTEVLILISTPYWYGVETHDGQHGWMMRDELEQK